MSGSCEHTILRGEINMKAFNSVLPLRWQFCGRGRRNRRPEAKPQRFRPRLEGLEDRTVPSTVNLFSVPTLNSVPAGITAGPDGNLWFTETSTSTFRGDQIARITPDGQITEFATPTPYGQPTFITAGPDGNLWYSENAMNQIGRVTPDGQFSEFPLPTPGGSVGITAGPDGNVWFIHGNNIAQITPDGNVTEFPIPTPNSLPSGITTGPDGNLWFTESRAGQIGEFVLNDGGFRVGAASAKSAPLAQAVRSAAVDAFFASVQPDPLRPVVVNQQPALAAGDAAFAASRPEVVPAPPAKQAVADAGTLHHQHKEDRAEAADAAGLADPLAADLAVVV
jgi:streptogramin lyase